MAERSRVSARRRVHVGAAVFYAAFLYVFSPMSLVVIGWFADFDDAISHRVHEVSIGALFTLGFLGVLAHLRREDRTTGAIQAVVALSLAAGVITVSTGFEPLAFAYLIPPIALIALDPAWRRVAVSRTRFDMRLMAFAALLLIALGPDVVANLEKAQLLVQGHESHWGAMAAFTIAVTLLAFVAAWRPPGWRLAAWSVITAVTVSAVVSMAFRYDASALGVSTSVGALLWASGYAVTVLIVGARDDLRVPVRRRDGRMVAGVATAVATFTGWKVGWVRAACAVPILGGAAYGVLWIALPSEDEAGRRKWRVVLLALLLGVGISSLVLGGGGLAFLLPMALVVATIILGLSPLGALVRGRLRLRTAAARVAAGIGLGTALLAIAVVWMLDDLSAPDVPHRIDSESFQYCASCHSVSGVARGAPVLPDIFEHSGGNLCVSCHSHLPLAPSAPTAASWRLPFTGIAP